MNNKLHTPLYLSVMRPAYHHYTPYQGSREKERLNIVKSLLNAGMILHPISPKTSLSACFHFTDVFEGAQFEKRKKETGKGKCVLHTAAKNGFGEILSYLTTTVAPPAPNRRGGLSPPPARDSVSKIEAILRSIDPAVRDNMGRTALHYAAMVSSSYTALASSLI